MASRAAKSAAAEKASATFGMTKKCVLSVCIVIAVVAFGVMVFGATRMGPRYSPFVRAKTGAASHINEGATHEVEPVSQKSTHEDDEADTAETKRPSAKEIHSALRETTRQIREMQDQLAQVKIDGKTVKLPTAQPVSVTGGHPADVAKQDAVRAAIKLSWDSYASKCFGQDELNPVTNSCENWLNQGNTLIDSLDTLWISGLRSEFKQARDWVASNAAAVFSRPVQVSFFESTIRVLGGLLAAFHLSGDHMFVDRAADIGKRLAAAFETKSGIPHCSVNLANRVSSNPGWTNGASVLSEVGSVQLEFFYLTKVTGDDQFRQKAQKVVDLLDRMHKSEPGLYPIYVRADQDTPSFASNVITLGAMGDSWYEYMLKMWVQSGGHSPNSEQYLRLYHESTKAVLNRLYRAADKSKQPAAGWAHLGDLNGGGYLPKMDHLVCFMSGVFALGVHRGAVTGDEAKRHMQAAIDIGETCANMYFFTASGVAPEFVNFGPQGSMHIGAGHNLLRPETVESMFILWRVTKDQKWRDFGWRIFQAFEKHCRTIRGYAGLEDVNQPHPRKKSRQESFWIAETLKYLYLLFSSDDLIPLDKYVFNTEAHPLPIFDGKSKQ